MRETNLEKAIKIIKDEIARNEKQVDPVKE